MKERPIIFSTQLIPKVLDGTKTMTRRRINPQPEKGLRIGCYYGEGSPTEWVLADEDGDPIDAPPLRCPYGQVGDRLWVRETFAYESPDGDRYVTVTPGETKILYHATEDWEGIRVPSIHMPRWASRILLEIVSLRAERLQEITYQDYLAEGMTRLVGNWNMVFRNVWNQFTPKHPWESNPWVWVIEFKALK